jgi:hypothetical protein
MTDEVWRGEIGEVGHRREGPVDCVSLERQPRRRFTGKCAVPCGRVNIVRQDLRSMVREARGDRGIERVSSALADNARGKLPAAKHVLEHRVASDVDDSHWQRALVMFDVPALREVDEQAAHRCLQSKTSVSICATSHIAATWR